MSTLDETLAEIRKRTKALVPGPWTWSVGGVEALDYDGNPVMIFEREGQHVTTRNDAAFVAHARTDVPTLLAAVEAALAVVSDMWEAADKANEISPSAALAISLWADELRAVINEALGVTE